MEINMPVKRAAIVLFFIVMFMAIGWMAPAMYSTYAPSNHFVEVHSFETQNATVGDDSHYICFDRTIRRPGNAVSNVEILRVGTDGRVRRTPVYIWGNTGYFEQGTRAVKMEFPLPENIDQGKYVYRTTATFSYSGGRVERTFVATSEPFYINNGPSAGDDWSCNRNT